jgi:hypothetical protein
VSAHTPGPWRAVERHSDAVTVIDARGFEIATAESMPILLDYAGKLAIDHWGERPGEAFIELSDEEQAANANLIAAAPDLLAAARLAMVRLRNADPKGLGTDTYRALDAAIAKAEGRTA